MSAGLDCPPGREPPHRTPAERLRRCLMTLCGDGYAHYSPNLSALRREALSAGRAWPSYRELLAAQSFHRHDFYADLAKSCRLLLKYEPLTLRRLTALDLDARRIRLMRRIARDLFTQIRSLARHPDPAVLRALPRILTRWNQTVPAGHWHIFGQEEVYGRLEFYLACTGNRQAQAHIASACLREALRQPKDTTAARLGLRTALGWLRFAGKENRCALGSDDVINGMTAAFEGDALCFPNLHRLTSGNVFRLLTGKSEPTTPHEPAPAAGHGAAKAPQARAQALQSGSAIRKSRTAQPIPATQVAQLAQLLRADQTVRTPHPAIQAVPPLQPAPVDLADPVDPADAAHPPAPSQRSNRRPGRPSG